MSAASPTTADVRAAAARIQPYVLRTPVLRNEVLDAMTGAQLWFKCENLQRGGAFKLRGAMNAVWSLSDDEAARGVATHSSGNHGAALARAARARGLPCHVVAPEGAVATKLRNIEEQGAILHRCAPTQAAREAALAALVNERGVVPVHPYADARVIAGQGTAALELIQQTNAEGATLDSMIAPVGGGGLLAGTALAAAGFAPTPAVHGAEPAGAADTYASLQRGERMTDVVPDTIADGLRAIVGEPNFDILRTRGVVVHVADDEAIAAAMRLIWERLKLIVEPSCAVPLAVLLGDRARFAGRRIGVILSGGNVDLDALPWSQR